MRDPKGATMNTLRTPNRIIAAALLSGGVAVAGIGLAAGTVGAYPPVAHNPAVGVRANPYPDM
jgi:hypothetical protein